ncbi:hypothetical protein WQ57_09745 [Mesobacillus campisalis]|uniref:Protein kinase domain-containing protein n=1 Tax=Mesobacillus campisalis TaxID=1408103 RepID=A0A0M2SWK1_9BACI|nr:hypothetical protein [Mesobacillus campisalis]KKK38096.1 hypothetical protein WQ57_09745 [Mesobacillus campisalis]
MMSTILSNSDIKSIHLLISTLKNGNKKNRKKMAEKAKEILQLKYKVIGCGKQRIVYDLQNGYVLKIAFCKLGIKSNETEFKMYNIHCPPELRKHLCPVIELGQGWIIMRKMESEVPMNKDFDKMLTELKNKFLMYGINPNDLTKYNLALSETGTITVIDYGNFKLK